MIEIHLVNNLMEQIKQFQPGFTLGETAETIQKLEDGTFIVTTNKGTQHQAKAIAIAGGLGTFEPRKRAARTGRNPQNGKPLKIPAKTVPAFSAGKKFKELVGKK